MLQELLLNIVLCVIAIVGYYILNFMKQWMSKLRAETESIKDDSIRKMTKDAIDRVDKLAEETVLAIESVTAKQLRELVKQGKAPRDQLCYLSKEAIEQVRGMLEPEYKQVLSDTVGDLDAYIGTIVEARLELFKALGTSAS